MSFRYYEWLANRGRMAQREVLAVMNKASRSAPKTSSKGRSGTLMESISPPRLDRKADVAIGEYNAVLASDRITWMRASLGVKKMKARFWDIFQQMRLHTGKQHQPDTDLP